MRARLLCTALTLAAAVLGAAQPASAGGPDPRPNPGGGGRPAPPANVDFSATFDGPDPTAGLHFANFEGGVRTPATMCGTDACASVMRQGPDRFLRIEVRPSANPGFYTNTDVAQLDLDQPDIANAGPYTPQPGRPVTLAARIRFSANYDQAGTAGTAQGTAGVVLWNTAFTAPSASYSPDYDQIGFTWASSDVLAGMISGFAASTFVDTIPVAVSRPAFTLDLTRWIDVEMVWAVDAGGAQTLTYKANGRAVGVFHLPAALHGLSLALWNDNQEPYPCPETGLCMSYANPDQTQAFDIDSVTVTQPAAHPADPTRPADPPRPGGSPRPGPGPRR